MTSKNRSKVPQRDHWRRKAFREGKNQPVLPSAATFRESHSSPELPWRYQGTIPPAAEARSHLGAGSIYNKGSLENTKHSRTKQTSSFPEEPSHTAAKSRATVSFGDSSKETHTLNHDNCASTAQTSDFSSSAIQEVLANCSAKDNLIVPLKEIVTLTGKEVLHQVFREATRDRPPEMSLFEFYETKSANVKVFKKNLNDRQKEKIQNDPEGLSFDITLLYLCIQYSHSRVADGQVEKWKEGHDCLESFLTSLKNIRNELLHDDLSIDEDQFIDRIEKLKELLTNILRCTEERYGMQPCDVEKIKCVIESINHHRDNSLKLQFLADCKIGNRLLKKLQLPQTVKYFVEKLRTATELDIPKYQELLTETLGLFQSEKLNISDNSKLKILEAINDTRICKREDWLKLLSFTNYDTFIAKFVSQLPDIFKGCIKIDDSTLPAYVSMLKAVKDPIRDASKVKITINIEGLLSVNELLDEINKKKLTVKRLIIHQDFRKPEDRMVSEDFLNETFQRCQLMEYCGAFTENMKLPATISSLRVSLASECAYNHLNNTFLASYKGSLALSLPISMNSLSLKPISATECLPDLYISDVESAELMDAVEIAKKLQPVRGKYMKFGRILFPRCSLHAQELGDLMEEMHKAMVTVSSYVSLPTNTKINGDDTRLQDLVKMELGCTQGIKLGGNIDDW